MKLKNASHVSVCSCLSDESYRLPFKDIKAQSIKSIHNTIVTKAWHMQLCGTRSVGSIRLLLFSSLLGLTGQADMLKIYICPGALQDMV